MTDDIKNDLPALPEQNIHSVQDETRQGEAPATAQGEPPSSAQGKPLANARDAGEAHINSLPMAWFHYVARGRLASGSRIMIRGRICARRGMYYQAQARVFESIHKEIPTFTPDEENAIGLTMLKRKV